MRLCLGFVFLVHCVSLNSTDAASSSGPELKIVRDLGRRSHSALFRSEKGFGSDKEVESVVTVDVPPDEMSTLLQDLQDQAKIMWCLAGIGLGLAGLALVAILGFWFIPGCQPVVPHQPYEELSMDLIEVIADFEEEVDRRMSDKVESFGYHCPDSFWWMTADPSHDPSMRKKRNGKVAQSGRSGHHTSDNSGGSVMENESGKHGSGGSAGLAGSATDSHKFQKKSSVSNRTERFSRVYNGSYPFNESVVDAALLLFVHERDYADKLLLLLGHVLSSATQLLLLLVLALSLVPSLDQYDEAWQQRLLDWRVDKGHHNTYFDSLNGIPFVQSVCEKSIWSYETANYTTIANYLFLAVPGYLLACVVVLVYVFTVMVEYRQAVEQLLAIVNLPRLGADRVGVRTSGKDRIEVVGIGFTSRIMALTLICLPRFVVLFGLLYYGCQYLSLTVGMSAMVENAVALNFIFSVKECLGSVLFTRKMRQIIKRLRPLNCGNSIKIMGFSHLDWFRYTLTIGMIIFSLCFWILPFAKNVEASAYIACGGSRDFTYEGGTPIFPVVTIMPLNSTVTGFYGDFESCSESMFKQMYTDGSASRPNVTIPKRKDMAKERSLEVLSYAFSQGCDGEMIMEPRTKRSNRIKFSDFTRECRTPPEELAAAISYRQWKQPYPDCTRYNASLPQGQCQKPTARANGYVPVCKLPWSNFACDNPSMYHPLAPFNCDLTAFGRGGSYMTVAPT